MREEKIAIVTRMVENGYCTFDRAIEQMADMMDLEAWQRAEKKFMAWKRGE